MKKIIFSSRNGRYIKTRYTWNFSLLYVRASLYKYRATTRILWSSITYHITSTHDLQWPCKAGHRTRLSTPIKQRCWDLFNELTFNGFSSHTTHFRSAFQLRENISKNFKMIVSTAVIKIRSIIQSIIYIWNYSLCPMKFSSEIIFSLRNIHCVIWYEHRIDYRGVYMYDRIILPTFIWINISF